MSIHEIQAERIRGDLLELLRHETPVADDTLHSALRHLKGRAASPDQVKAALRWLERQGLVTIEAFDELLSATITGTGLSWLAREIYLDGIVRRSAG